MKVIAVYGESRFVLLVSGERDPLAARVRMFDRRSQVLYPETGIGPLALCNGYLTDPPADLDAKAVVAEALLVLRRER